MEFLVFVVAVLIPGYLTYRNIDSLLKDRRSLEQDLIDGIGILLGGFLTDLFLDLIEITFQDWQVVLQNRQVHSPLYSGSIVTLATLFGLSLVGCCILSRWSSKQLPPLVTVLSMSSLYIGIGLCLVWMIQMSPFLQEGEWLNYLFCCLFPLNYLIICLRRILLAVKDWKESQHQLVVSKHPWLHFLDGLLQTSFGLPVLGFLALIPLLGIVVMVLTLFGQQADSVIKAFTETSDWQLSQKISPPNVSYDEHYLCTVGAAGHRRVVKPLRMGVRHGHRVVVNRQLCIANAFEQILEERVPKIHAVIRRNYDRYGYPISRHIKKAWQADIIYLLMKPLEWCFLLVLYLTDAEPESRIAKQYLPPFPGK